MIKSKYIGFFLLCAMLLVFSGCRPRGILSSGEMREVLVDLHKTDAMIQMAGLSMYDREGKSVYYAQVLQRHGITQAQFDSSVVWYTAHPYLFNKIYPKVMADLEAEEKRFIAQMEQQINEVPSQDIWTCPLDTTYFTLLKGFYPTLRDNAPLVHDSIDQLFPQISVLR